jgi:tetratricopeptide (TPR) repeat protein
MPSRTLCFTPACALVAIALFGQAESSSDLQGSVRDSQGQPVAAATVQLKTSGQTLTARTDSQGSYRFRELRAGSYTLHASESKFGEADFGPFQLGEQEGKKVDLVLSSSAKPQFFDEPTFIVAGVTDPSQRGGHGSDPVLRSAESLAKSTAALRTGSADDTNPLEAVRQYQRAAVLDPSEPNLFNWGAELLTHRAADQAVEVFSNSHRLFPHSARMLLGLAVALYSRGSYDEAAQRFFEATDLNPSDPAPYLFLGKVSSGAITKLDGFAERMQRFAKLQPDNAWANYYYATTLTRTPPKAQALLERAVRLDPKLGDAFLLLGNVYADEGNLPKAISAYQSAIAASSQLEETHYRLAMAYRKTGATDKAQKELDLYQQLRKQSAEALERERAEIQQFVFELKHQ